MAEIRRIMSEEARRRVSQGGALLVCAYESDELYRRNHLEGAIAFQEFISRHSLDKAQEIIFYCA